MPKLKSRRGNTKGTVTYSCTKATECIKCFSNDLNVTKDGPAFCCKCRKCGHIWNEPNYRSSSVGKPIEGIYHLPRKPLGRPREYQFSPDGYIADLGGEVEIDCDPLLTGIVVEVDLKRLKARVKDADGEAWYRFSELRPATKG